ncbi:MAG: Holliday junction branch migration protein RuvA [Chloroflexi bacterium]|uniref:Holliday junction branch migration complex subunit RuvA n=1 Tax=Candidatus Thermofonsia Clade 3 bacterium TaxID=2364212 RepID=A0A2M8QH32_9CHLR|nr:MAG: Holliday junction branch migration protein RuvA [Candidatus Thermofonsia Clade 3 bacterium]RMG62760.1 MAG: Holliday junction branch migration protein RuvA [Chloroflexota bacterium]
MISRIRGVVLSLKPPTAIVDVQGVGFRVWCSQAALDGLILGRPCDLHTHLIVREDGLALYGFAGEEEAELFSLLLSVQGVGARTALALLSKLPPEALRQAIANQQVEALARAPGVGKKTADKIIFALRGKLSGLDARPPSAPLSAMDAEVIAALTALGYSVVEAQQALASLPRDVPLDLEEKIRRALAYFG